MYASDASMTEASLPLAVLCWAAFCAVGCIWCSGLHLVQSVGDVKLHGSDDRDIGNVAPHGNTSDMGSAQLGAPDGVQRMQLSTMQGPQYCT